MNLIEELKKISRGILMKERIMYEDCRKNHAASIGKYVVDGCCKFMPAGEEGSHGALKCAACNCHRNFHRKVVHQFLTYGDCSSKSSIPK
ncbi:mini zinc finger 2-like [Olea europaea subsp. europaea]|uniref:Mini zinc finger 2-like n=2 Tax=Olea europaea subsp. europaea TaxID=158383 RepID=A0A8S0S7N9_OLEEU|nr:mini zinc finger 2-like [Olea europaea subsp. europaea]